MNTLITFVNNSAGLMGSNTNSMYCGHSIYATTLLPCHYACRKNTADDQMSIADIFNALGNLCSRMLGETMRLQQAEQTLG